MALPTTGKISFSDIQREFGRTTNGSFGEYRITDTQGGQDFPLDNGIPTTGRIRFSDFHGKKLNILVDFYSENTQKQDIKGRFNENEIHVIGPRDSKPSSTSGKKIIAHVNKIVSASEQSKIDGRLSCSLKTGQWDPNTDLIINIGSEGTIIGAGGDGGRGSEGAGDFFAGKDGTSAIGINTTQDVSIINNGLISCGFGGGGGGKGGSKRVSTGKKSSVTAVSSGGGGGGGSGSPVGLGGGKGTGASRGSDGDEGQDGKTNPLQIGAGGAGGFGGNTDGVGSLNGGQGGDSGAVGDEDGGPATDGDNSGGAAGNNGFLIVTIDASVPDNISGSGTNLGTNSLNTTPI